jgi:xanthine phosphoribosyltransferase
MQKIKEVLSKKFPQTNFKTLSIFQKENASILADFYAQITDEWIDFFWENEITLQSH